MKVKKKSAVMLCGVFCTALTAVPVLADTEVQKYTNTDFAMDTVVSETLYTTGDDLNTAIGQKIRDIETEYLSWTDERTGLQGYGSNTSDPGYLCRPCDHK